MRTAFAPATLLLLLCAFAPSQVLALSFDVEDAPLSRRDATHESETDMFAPVKIGEWGRTTFITFNPHYVNVTDNKGHKDSFSKRLVTGMTWLSLRWEEQLNYRVDEDSTFKLRPTLSFGWSYMGVGSHEDFQLATIDDRATVESSVNHETLYLDFGTQVGWQEGGWEGYLDYRTYLGFRHSRYAARDTLYTLPESGVIDSLRRRKVDERDDLVMHGLGLGVAYNFKTEPWNYRMAFTYRPWTHVKFRESSEDVQGVGIDFQAGGLRLRDDINLALRFRWDWWFDKGDLDAMHWFEIGVGVRFS